MTWVHGKLLEKKQRKRCQDRIEAASAALEKLNEKLLNLRSKRAHRRERVEEAAEKIVRRYKVKKYLSYWSHDFDVSKFRQDGPGRPGQGTRYRKKPEKRYAISFEINTPAVEYDKRPDGMDPLLSNERELTPREVFEAHKRQPKIEKRFQQPFFCGAGSVGVALLPLTTFCTILAEFRQGSTRVWPSERRGGGQGLRAVPW